MDFTYLPFECHRAAICGLAMLDTFSQVLILGTGAGTLPSFIHHNFEQAHISTVDIEPTVVQIAQEHFGMRETNRLRSFVVDAA
jgi:spermidine synthase